MKFLIDTNVFIEREGDWPISESLQELENLLKTKGHTILIHPLSKEEIGKYENEEGREIAESKIATYAKLSYPDYPTSGDTKFRNKVPEVDDFNEQVDNALIFAVFCGRVDFLITEDQGIHKKARRLGIGDQVLTIKRGCNRVGEERAAFEGPPSIQKVQVGDLDVSDPIFDSLKKEYDFAEWFEGIPERDAYVNWNPDGTLGAVLILKHDEVEAIGDEPVLPKRERLKISTLKVARDRRGSKIGELLISISIREAIQHELEEVYLTHQIESNDYLVKLISQYGFLQASQKSNGEQLFLKRLTPGPDDDPEPQDVHGRFYPSFYDGPEVTKFLVPIRPNFHSKLFPTYDKRQPKLTEFGGKFLSEGNAIKKAYLSNAKTRQLEPNDVLLFYRSHDHKELTSLCVCERVEYNVTDVETVQELVGRRSVFTEHEISEMVEDPTTVILFKWHFELTNPLHYQVLLDEDVLSGPPQTIQEINEAAYKYIREAGGIDERFTVN